MITKENKFGLLGLVITCLLCDWIFSWADGQTFQPVLFIISLIMIEIIYVFAYVIFPEKKED